MAQQLNHSTLHYALMGHVVDQGYAPSVQDLSGQFDRSESEIITALKALQEYHGVVLHPHNSEVWVIHPFSMAPTNFLVRQQGREWWGNCAWCSLGAAVLLGGEVTITTTLGANGPQVQLRIIDEELIDPQYYVHFPIPMVECWQNVVFTCSTMLLFDSESAIQTWSQRHHIPVGDIQPVANVFELAKVWYGNHLSPHWQKWTLEESKAIFQRFHLTGSIWDIPISGGRF